uniref:carboxypeptidase regulatory-like domain-containing protein n=1 Tax=Gemmatimonas sp. TaxID=1962908 RepID=UPI00333FB2E8
MAGASLAVAAHGLHAQDRTGTIRGRVTDAEGGTPLATAQVVITGTRLGAVTGADGRYVLRGVTPGSVSVRVIRLGY